MRPQGCRQPPRGEAPGKPAFLLPGRPPPRLLIIGSSEGPICGVRDFAHRLSSRLEGRGWSVTSVWNNRVPGLSLSESSSQLKDWTTKIRRTRDSLHPDATLVHYSVFAFSFRGVPLCAALGHWRRPTSKLPVVTFLHEYAYPWRRRGWRGATWAITQRLALWFVVARSSALLVTTTQRATWISSRRWLPRRPVDVSPVFSNLPSARARYSPTPEGGRVGVFGYGSEAVALHLLLDAFTALRVRAPRARLWLLGAPGPESPTGRRVLTLARERGLGEAVDFTGVLRAEELSDALVACDVLLFADDDGPSSRKTTLAASLASGRPVVAIDGPQTWGELIAHNAVAVVPRQPVVLAEAIERLLADRVAADALGARGRAFAEGHMSVDRAADVVLGVLSDVLAGA